MFDLAFNLYTKRLTTRDIEEVFKNSFSRPLSASSISNITCEFEKIRKSWQERKLDEDVVLGFKFIGIHCKVLEKKKRI